MVVTACIVTKDSTDWILTQSEALAVSYAVSSLIFLSKQNQGKRICGLSYDVSDFIKHNPSLMISYSL